MIITGSDLATISDVKRFRKFEMKDQGLLRSFLGIGVASSPKGYLLGQSKYAIDILHRARLTNTKTIDTPLELHAKFSASNGVPLENLREYRELVGCLVYIPSISKPILSPPF